MNILICDDRPEEAAALEELFLSSDFDVSVTTFEQAVAALDCVRSGVRIDLCVLDIIMPDMDGIALARALREMGYSNDIVFLSSSKDYGPDSYTVDAFSYLLKPPTPEAVKALLDKLQERNRNADRGEIVVHTATVSKIIPYQQISYVEVIQHNVYFNLVDGSEISVTATFSDIAQELLRDMRFVRCHRSYIVNMQDVAEVSGREIVTRGGTRIIVPRSYRETTRGQFYQWKFGGNER